jgi:hypothetical protein
MIRAGGTRVAKLIFRQNITTRRLAIMPEYPGLGLPLRHFPQGNHPAYPMGIHGNCYGGDSDILPVREVAMMIVMDKLTDKPDWHKKVFDDDIIAKWCKEALNYPDDSLWKQAIGGKVNHRWAGQDPDQGDIDWASKDIKPLEGIMSFEAFDFVSKADYSSDFG